MKAKNPLPSVNWNDPAAWYETLRNTINVIGGIGKECAEVIEKYPKTLREKPNYSLARARPVRCLPLRVEAGKEPSPLPVYEQTFQDYWGFLTKALSVAEDSPKHAKHWELEQAKRKKPLPLADIATIAENAKNRYIEFVCLSYTNAADQFVRRMTAGESEEQSENPAEEEDEDSFA